MSVCKLGFVGELAFPLEGKVAAKLTDEVSVKSLENKGVFIKKHLITRFAGASPQGEA